MGHRRTLGLVLLWQTTASVCYYAVFAATPFFRAGLGLSATAVGYVVTALTLGYALALLPVGAAVDRFGEHFILTGGLLGLASGMVLVTTTWSFVTLLGAVLVLGAAYATAIPGTNRAIFGRFSPDRQNLALGIKQVGVTAGSGVSALLVTRVAGILSWEAAFYAAAATSIVAAAIFWVGYHGGDADVAASPDPRQLLGNGSYLWLVAGGACLGAGLFTTTGYIIIYVSESVGAAVAFGGVVFATAQVSGSVGRVVTGWLADALPGNPRHRIGAILIVQAVTSAVLFVGVGITDDRIVAAIVFTALGFFIFGFTGVYYSCMATLVSPDEMGSATAGGQLALLVGALVAPPAFGYLADTAGYGASWSMLGALALASTAFIAQAILTDPPIDVSAAGNPSDR